MVIRRLIGVQHFSFLGLFFLFLALLAPSFAAAQGLLLDERTDHRYRLPRIISRPHP